MAARPGASTGNRLPVREVESSVLTFNAQDETLVSNMSGRVRLTIRSGGHAGAMGERRSR
ncbi:hypothetical protein MICRO8M_100103 [Microbacterium sp. 8M]|nr:hypothetical protein MICRO8M_100103 [Microbacterium sp. 8M]